MSDVKKQSPFRFVNLIKRSVPQDTQQLKEFLPFLINRSFYFKSGNERICNLMNHFWKLDKGMLYKLYQKVLGNKEIGKWISKGKQPKKNEKMIEYFKRKYDCSIKTAEDYILCMTKEQLKEFKRELK